VFWLCTNFCDIMLQAPNCSVMAMILSEESLFDGNSIRTHDIVEKNLILREIQTMFYDSTCSTVTLVGPVTLTLIPCNDVGRDNSSILKVCM